MADTDTPDQRDKTFAIPSEITVELKVPLKKMASDETLERLSFKPPNFLQLRKINEEAVKRGDLVASAFALIMLTNDGLTTPDVEHINAIDFQLIQEALGPFVRLEPKKDSKD
jgi:hypothetical protein